VRHPEIAESGDSQGAVRVEVGSRLYTPTESAYLRSADTKEMEEVSQKPGLPMALENCYW
jgi:hypothetical protein